MKKSLWRQIWSCLRLPLTSDDYASWFNWSLKNSRTSPSRRSSSICWFLKKSWSGDFEVDKSIDPRNVLSVPEIWRVPSVISLLSYLHLNDPCESVQLFLSYLVVAWYHADAYENGLREKYQFVQHRWLRVVYIWRRISSRSSDNFHRFLLLVLYFSFCL